MTTKPTAIAYFEKELKGIQDDTLRTFFENALAAAPQSFHDDAVLMLHTKTAYHILWGLLKQRDVKGTVRDALLGTVLLCDMLFHEFAEDMRPLHSVAVRTYLETRGINQDIQKGLFENIMRAVEAHHGDKGASPILDAKPGTAEFEVMTAFNVASLGYVSLNWEVIYDEISNEEEN